MRPVKVASSNLVYHLPGGNEDNDLHCQRVEPGQIHSVWLPTQAERQAIAAGANVELAIFGEPIPPVSLRIVEDEPVAPLRAGE